MSKQTAVVDVSAFTTDAKFRTWGLAASTAIQATGLTKTGDTGQINWATVTKPVSTQVKAGYEIYRFNDVLQATRPIFLRVDYGSGGVASGHSMSTWITIGTASDGAGTLTGLTLGPYQSGYNGTGAPINTGMSMHFSYSATYGYVFMNFGMGPNVASGDGSATTPGCWMIERFKDSSGNPIGTGVRLFSTHISTSTTPWPGWADRSINFDNAVTYGTARTAHCGVLSISNSLSTASSVATYRHYSGAPGPFPVIGFLSFFGGDVPNGTTFSATPVGGTAHTYYVWTLMTQGDSSGNSSIGLGYVWED